MVLFLLKMYYIIEVEYFNEINRIYVDIYFLFRMFLILWRELLVFV